MKREFEQDPSCQVVVCLDLVPPQDLLTCNIHHRIYGATRSRHYQLSALHAALLPVPLVTGQKSTVSCCLCKAADCHRSRNIVRVLEFQLPQYGRDTGGGRV